MKEETEARGKQAGGSVILWIREGAAREPTLESQGDFAQVRPLRGLETLRGLRGAELVWGRDRRVCGLEAHRTPGEHVPSRPASQESLACGHRFGGENDVNGHGV